MVLGNESYTVGRADYNPFKSCHICKECVFVGCAAELRMWVSPMKGLTNLLCQCQTTVFISFYFIFAVATDSSFQLIGT